MLVHRAANLENASGVAHGFFGRQGGVSKGVYASLNCGFASGDAPAPVTENRKRALAVAGRDLTLLTLNQIHGERTVRVDAPWPWQSAPQADAMVTNVRRLALGILTADCAPILLADAEAGVIGAAHSGWKGALAGVIESVVSAMTALGARRERIEAAIGPAISQSNYEVGAELQSDFVERSPDDGRFFREGSRPGHFQFDLEALVAQRLKKAGVGSIECLSLCTYADESSFFSHRRATHVGQSGQGRQISMIALGKEPARPFT